MRMKVSHNGNVISENVWLADTFWSRLIGFMFSRRPVDGTGILFETNSIHTCFMRFDLDVVFLNANNMVVKIIRNMKPWRMTRFYFKAKKVVELPSGLLPSSLKEGDQLEVVHV